MLLLLLAFAARRDDYRGHISAALSCVADCILLLCLTGATLCLKQFQGDVLGQGQVLCGYDCARGRRCLLGDYPCQRFQLLLLGNYYTDALDSLV